MIDAILLLLLAFLYMRYMAPLVIKWRKVTPDAVAPDREEGRAASFVVYALDDAQIPSNQWRTVATGIDFMQVGLFGIRFSAQRYNPGLFGQLMVRATFPFQRGSRVHPRLVSTNRGIGVVIYNDNQAYFLKIQKGDPVAIVEFSRSPFVVLKEQNKKS